MDRVYYNKLVRDNIPEKIQSKGSECEVRELSEHEFSQELRKKVGEEASALLGATTREELVEELGDVLDVIDEIISLEKISLQELQLAREQALKKKGGFAKKLFLLWSSDDGYKTNETKNS